MDAIPALLSSVFGKIEPMLSAPTPESIRNRLIAIWRAISACQSLDPESALAQSASSLASLLQETKSAMQSGHESVVLAAFTDLAIIPTLVAFAISDRPPHFVDVLLPFLEAHLAPPLVPLVTDSWLSNLANLLEYGARPKRSAIAKFTHQAILFVSARPAYIPRLLTAPTRSPFFRRAFQMISLLYQCMGALALQIAWHAAADAVFERYIVCHSAYVTNCVTFIIECMLDRTADRGKFRFCHELAMSIENGPEALRRAFCEEYEKVVVWPFVVEAEPQMALENAIWLLGAFEGRAGALCLHLEERLPGWVVVENEEVAVLALRCASMMLEVARVMISEKVPSSVRITADFREMLPPEWFRKDETAELVRATTNQAICAGFVRANAYVWVIDGVLQACGRLMQTFLENPMRVNLALTEFYAKAAVSAIPGGMFVFLSKECRTGLYPIVAGVCQTCTRRFASKPTSEQAIGKAYLILVRKTMKPPTEQGLPYRNIVTLIEFLKELDAIVLSKNLLNQRDLTS